MKKFWKPLILAALTALCVAPAHALEYVAPSSVSLASAYGESSLTTLGLLSPQSLGGGVGAPLLGRAWAGRLRGVTRS